MFSDKPYEAPNTAGVFAPPPPLIYGDAPAAGLLAKTLFPIDFLPRWVMGLLGRPLLGIGLLPFLSSLRSLRLARTDARPHKPTSSLVVKDPYHFTRNPIYLGFTFCSGGITALANSPRPPCCSLRPHRHAARGDRTRGALPGSLSSARSTSGTRHASSAESESRHTSETEAYAAARAFLAVRQSLRLKVMDLRRGTGHSPEHRRCCRTGIRARTLADRS